MHPITSLLSTLLLSTTLTSALPATDPRRNIANANQPQHSTTSTTDPVSPPGAYVRRQKVAKPYVLIVPDRKPGWKQSSEPELDLAVRQVKWLPPHRNYLPVPDKAFKARDVDVSVNDDSGVERRQKVAQPWVLVAPDRKKGDWKRSEEPVEPAENGDSPGVVARQIKKPLPITHVGPASGRTWFKARDVEAGEEPVAPVENDNSSGVIARQFKTLLPIRVSLDRSWFKVRDVEAGEEVGDGNRKRDKGSYVSAGANLKPWESSEKLQMYW